LAGGVINAATNYANQVARNIASGQPPAKALTQVNTREIGAAFVAGAVAGALSVTPFGAWAGPAGLGAAGNVLQYHLSTSNRTVAGYAIAAATGFVGGRVAGHPSTLGEFPSYGGTFTTRYPNNLSVYILNPRSWLGGGIGNLPYSVFTPFTQPGERLAGHILQTRVGPDFGPSHGCLQPR
jgi:hypothetical protein